jgi:hypothetical protein
VHRKISWSNGQVRALRLLPNLMNASSMMYCSIPWTRSAALVERYCGKIQAARKQATQALRLDSQPEKEKRQQSANVVALQRSMHGGVAEEAGQPQQANERGPLSHRGEPWMRQAIIILSVVGGV